MLQPYQCLLYCARSESEQSDVLLAASGAFMLSFSIRDGSFLSSWPLPLQGSLETSADSGDHVSDSERQAKRQKVSLSQDTSVSDSADIVVENSIDVDPLTNSNTLPLPNVAKLVCTSDSKYVAAVTAEDKTVRVLELLHDGSLSQISARYYFPLKVCLCRLPLTVKQADAEKAMHYNVGSR